MTSYHNRLLRINLSNRTIQTEQPGTAYLRRYLGGWNLILETLLREAPAGIDALSPENILIFAPGVVTGLPLAGADRMAVGAKSPLTGGLGAAEVGGYWGTELKQAGYDGILVEGRSPAPVYVWINDDQVEIRDASRLWGMATKECSDSLRQELGDERIRVASIGPAGENQVRFANIMFGLYDAAGRTGLGAVMGSKNLKAIAVRGTRRVQAAHGELLKQISKEFAAKGKNVEWLKMGTGSRAMNYLVSTGNLPVRNFRDGAFPNAINLDGETLLNQMGQGMDACYACAVRCKKRVGATEPFEIDAEYGGPEYESIASLGSACGVEDGAGMCKANELCNAFGLDSISTGVTIAFAMECFEEGLLNLEDTEGIELRFGSVDALLLMIHKIARREGLGSILADGPAYAADRIGGDASKYAIHVKNQPFPAHEPRLKRSLTFGYAVSPTGADHIQGMQDHALSVEAADGLPADPMLRGLGLLKPLSKNDIGHEKVRASVYYSMIIGLLNSLVFCHLVQLGVEMTVEDKTRLVRAATGWDVSVFELLKVGERAMTLARLFNMREGLTSADDRLPERVYQPTRDGALADVYIDRKQVQEAIHLYYAMMGWDQATGVPLEGKLHELDLSWAVGYLPKDRRF